MALLDFLGVVVLDGSGCWAVVGRELVGCGLALETVTVGGVLDFLLVPVDFDVVAG